MTKVTVSEDALRELVREALDGNEFEPIKFDVVNVNQVVDPSASVTDPLNPDFTPQTKPELDVAMHQLVKDVTIDKVPSTYKAFKAVIDADEEETMKKDEEEMKKQEDGGQKNVEEAVRKAVRTMLSEITPRFDTSYSGTEYGSSYDDDDDEEEKERDEKPGRKRKAYKPGALGNMADVDGATFDELAKEMGLSVAGAKRAVDMALEKARWMATQVDPDELEILILTTMKDYIDLLSKSGELSPADVALMKDHPEIVRELDGFREFLHNSLRRARKGGELANPLGEVDAVDHKIGLKTGKGVQETAVKKRKNVREAREMPPEIVPNGPRGAHPDVGDPDDMNDDPEYLKWASQGEPCPMCGGQNTEPVESPSMYAGMDHGVLCLDCKKTSMADPFKGGYGKKSARSLGEATTRSSSKPRPKGGKTPRRGRVIVLPGGQKLHLSAKDGRYTLSTPDGVEVARNSERSSRVFQQGTNPDYKGREAFELTYMKDGEWRTYDDMARKRDIIGFQFLSHLADELNKDKKLGEGDEQDSKFDRDGYCDACGDRSSNLVEPEPGEPGLCTRCYRSIVKGE